MKRPDKSRPSTDEPPPKLERSQEARQVIEEYADSLREIIRALRRRLNSRGLCWPLAGRMRGVARIGPIARAR
jgi:hypothetical protein